MQNPFKYGKVVSGNHFCSRVDLETQLSKHIASNQNVHLDGERRTGKTSLVFQTAKKSKSKILHIDLFQVKSTSEVYEKILNGILKLNSTSGFLSNLMKTISSLQPSMTFNHSTGDPSINISSSEEVLPKNISGLLDYIYQNYKNKKIIVFIDEFQDIKNLEEKDAILATMRSSIQLHSDITYVYAGSIRKDMSEIFNNPNSPFYKSALPLEVEKIDKKLFSKFIKQNFNKTKIKISQECIDKILILANEIPGDVQELCNSLWDSSENETIITQKNIDIALDNIFCREQRYYESIINITTNVQMNFLKGLSKTNGENIYSAEFAKYSLITQSAAITRALKRLLQLKIIYEYKDKYRFASPFFKLWLDKQ